MSVMEDDDCNILLSLFIMTRAFNYTRLKCPVDIQIVPYIQTNYCTYKDIRCMDVRNPGIYQ